MRIQPGRCRRVFQKSKELVKGNDQTYRGNRSHFFSFLDQNVAQNPLHPCLHLSDQFLGLNDNKRISRDDGISDLFQPLARQTGLHSLTQIGHFDNL